MESLLAHCSEVFTGREAVMLAFFLGGLTGGFTHCLTMCGPYVACERMCAGKACGGAAQKTGLAYHLGRITTYSGLGFVAAFAGAQIAATSWWPMLAALMLAGAGLLFLHSCLEGIKIGKLTYARGLLLGFMPCGLIYAALMVAATLGSPLRGALAMLLFALGTVPALLIASLGADFVSHKKQEIMARAGRVLMAFNGLSLLVMAVRIVR